MGLCGGAGEPPRAGLAVFLPSHSSSLGLQARLRLLITKAQEWGAYQLHEINKASSLYFPIKRANREERKTQVPSSCQ